MSCVVWKYEIPDGKGSFELTIPEGAEFAHLGTDIGSPCMWFVVGEPVDEWPLRTRRFYARDTGAPLRDEDVQSTVRFLGTYATWLPRLEVWNVRHVWMEG